MWRYSLFFLILFVNCTGSEVTTPTIEMDKMAKILADIHIVEGSFQNVLVKHKDSIASNLYHQTFEHHKVTSEGFYKNHAAYFNSPELLEELYEKVLAEIDAKKALHQPKNRGKSKKTTQKK